MAKTEKPTDEKATAEEKARQQTIERARMSPAERAKADREAAAKARETGVDAAAIADKQAKIDALKAEIAELEKPIPVEFPKMLYHAQQPARIVNSQQEHDDLLAREDGWVESTAELPDAAKQPSTDTVRAATGAPSDHAPTSARVTAPAAEKPPSAKDRG